MTEDLKKKYLKRAHSLVKKKQGSHCSPHNNLSLLHRTPLNEDNWIHPLSSSTPVTSNDVSYHSEVNRELKRLLLASLGSDVQQEIDQLVRDRSHLKQSLDITLHHLTECTEELDQVTVECDIWRSKVLASRVLIDELKKWKVQATSDSYKSQQAITTLLKERQHLSNYLKDCHSILFDIVQILGQRLSSKQLSQQYGGLQVAAVSPIQLSQISNSGGTIVDVAKTTAVAAKVIFEKINGLDKETLPTSHSTPLHMLPSEGEKMAKKALHSQHQLTQVVPSTGHSLPHLSFGEKHLLQQRRHGQSSASFWEETSLSINHCRNCRGPLLIL